MSFICMRTQIVPVFIVLSFIGWIVFIAGFGKQNEEYVSQLYNMQPCEGFVYLPNKLNIVITCSKIPQYRTILLCWSVLILSRCSHLSIKQAKNVRVMGQMQRNLSALSHNKRHQWWSKINSAGYDMVLRRRSQVRWQHDELVYTTRIYNGH